jgi:hypothetical protein
LSSSQLLRGVPIGGDESEVGVPQLAADGPRRGMNGRRGGPLGLGRLTLGIWGQDGLGAEGLDSGALSAGGGFFPLLRRQASCWN